MAGLYTHIPFCHSKCAYCDFYSSPDTRHIDKLIDALCKEFATRKDEIDWSSPNTIYLGGGTPSIIPCDILSRYIESLECISPKDCIEFTIEVNPEDVLLERVNDWHEMGINRISMGVQSLNDAEIKFIGRRHSAQQAIDAVETIRKAGIDNFSLDLIYGLPYQTLSSWRDSLSGIFSLRPKHLSAYMLSYEYGTRLYAMKKTGKIKETDEDMLLQMYKTLIEETAKAGYIHYEISNFALPGYEAKHNSSYWDGTPYLGIGPAAHSFDGNIRRINPSSIKTYLDKIDISGNAYEIDEENDDNRFNDMLITALRTIKGLNLSDIAPIRRKQLLTDAEPYINNGSLKLYDDILTFDEHSWPISDSILSSLVQIS